MSISCIAISLKDLSEITRIECQEEDIVASSPEINIYHTRSYREGSKTISRRSALTRASNKELNRYLLEDGVLKSDIGLDRWVKVDILRRIKSGTAPIDAIKLAKREFIRDKLEIDRFLGKQKMFIYF